MAAPRAITCHHEDIALDGQILVPDAPGQHPAVMVMHTAYGIGDHVLRVADRLVREGYVAIVTDMFGGGVHFDDLKAAGASIAPLRHNPGLLRSRVLAWYALSKTIAEVDAGRIAAIGYCLGGECVLELARSGADVKVVVSYHGILATKAPALPQIVKAHVAVFTGARDPYVPPEQVEAFRSEMIAAGACWLITEFGEAYHAFTDPAVGTVSGSAYDPLANATSWASTLALLKARIKGE